VIRAQARSEAEETRTEATAHADRTWADASGGGGPDAGGGEHRGDRTRADVSVEADRTRAEASTELEQARREAERVRCRGRRGRRRDPCPCQPRGRGAPRRGRRGARGGRARRGTATGQGRRRPRRRCGRCGAHPRRGRGASGRGATGSGRSRGAAEAALSTQRPKRTGSAPTSAPGGRWPRRRRGEPIRDDVHRIRPDASLVDTDDEITAYAREERWHRAARRTPDRQPARLAVLRPAVRRRHPPTDQRGGRR
jgi:hypothetical protein